MNIDVRQESACDYASVAALIEAAFLKAEHSSHKEALLVERIRTSDRFVPELSLVAIDGNTIVGHILLSVIHVQSPDGTSRESLALAPVSVHPDYQRQGIGAQLIKHAHQMARELGYRSIILLGHAAYYPRFGYQRASKWNIHPPFDVPDEVFMGIELVPGGLANVSGIVRYPAAFDGV